MLALYFLSLGVSGALIGAFARHALAGLGLVPGYMGGLFLAGCVVCLYVGAQFLFMALLRLMQPCRSMGPYVTEMFSHYSALALLPYLLGVEVAWPHPLMARAEALMYMGAFVALHLFFKAATYYASLQGEPGKRLGGLGWLAACGLCAWGAYGGFTMWLGETERGRPGAPETQSYYRVGDQYALARPLREGSTFDGTLQGYDEPVLRILWANLPLGGASGEIDRIHARVTLHGAERKTYVSSLALSDDGWAEMVIPSEFIPAHAERFRVQWSRMAAPAWLRLLGLESLNLVAPSGREGNGLAAPPRVLLAGPFENPARDAVKGPNFLVIAVEGLGAGHVSMLGYERLTTPSLDQLGDSSLVFRNAYVTAPGAAAPGAAMGCMSLLTGASPARHGLLGDEHGPLPDGVGTVAEALQAKGYATAAFTEGGALGMGKGFERGFDLFDVSYDGGGSSPTPADPGAPDAAGSKATLERARTWIGAHRGSAFFVFIRLSELADVVPRARYETRFVEDKSVSLERMDVYDSAVAYLDGQLGSLFKYVRDRETRRNTCIVVTSPYGIDFSGSEGESELTAPSLRVPVIVHAPGVRGEMRSDRVGLEDVAATMLDLAGAEITGSVEGASLLE